ncbi:hypothetical protein PHMEG_00025871 [Phytophthora megakarya]|uniref:Uncharacterized protein n=1 Tax=Phytophthora megakarya TaxID=4795 RepID=A0A225VC83_9STRA|nr:hypothetical protein PHMEG_00025871 [Phytophthora megakarya]
MRAAWAAYLEEECAKVMARSDGKDMALKAPDLAWGRLSISAVQGGFKHIDILFDGRENVVERDQQNS